MISVQCINKVILLQLHFVTSIRCFIFFFNSIRVMSICLFSQKFFIFDYPGIEIQKILYQKSSIPHKLGVDVPKCYIMWDVQPEGKEDGVRSNCSMKKVYIILSSPYN